MVLSAITGLGLAIVAIVCQTPIYRTTATIYIDPRDSNGFQEAGGILLNSDALIVDSEVEILLSSSLAERVVDRLGLATPPEPGVEKTTLTARLNSWLKPGAELDQSGVLSPSAAAKRRAVTNILKNLEVSRRGDTYVIEITTRNQDKQLAAEIANTYTEEYLESNLEVQSTRFSQLNQWSSAALREALVALRQAEAKINDFKLSNQIDSDGSQMAVSELNQANAALVALRNERFQNELILERIRNSLRDDRTGPDVQDVEDEGIREIRSRILETEIRYAKVIATESKNSPQAGVMLRDLEALRAQLIDQYRKIAEQLDGNVQYSISEEMRLNDRAETLRQEVADVSAKQAELAELVMKAEGERAVYQSLLTRLNETSDVLAYKSNSARVLTPAQVPAGPSEPQTGKMLALGIIFGLFIGAILIFVREQLDTGIRQPREIEAAGLKYLGALPFVPRVWFPWSMRLGLRDLTNPRVSGRRNQLQISRMSVAVDFPLSELSETIRSIVFDAASKKGKPKAAQIVAVTSVNPGEGKSMLAANLAAYFAKQGKDVHLVDFDLKKPTLSRLFSTHSSYKELVDQVCSAKVGSKRSDTNTLTDFEFSGQTEQTRASDIIEFFVPEAIASYLEGLKTNFDTVVVDVGALSESSDARMCADLADYVVLAVRWNTTSIEQLERVLSQGRNRPDNSIAAVLTMVPPSERLTPSATSDQAVRRLQVA